MDKEIQLTLLEYISEAVGDFGVWSLLIAFLLLLVFSAYLLLRLVNTLGKASKVKLGAVEWSVDKLGEIVIKAEELKAQVRIATAGGNYGPELEKLSKQVVDISSHIGKITRNQRLDILKKSLVLAGADDIISVNEQKALRAVAKSLELTSSDLESIKQEYLDEWPNIQWESSK